MNKFSLGQSEFTNYHYEKDLELSTRYLLTLIKTRWTAGNMKTRFFAVSLCDCPANHGFLATKLTPKLPLSKRSDIIDVSSYKAWPTLTSLLIFCVKNVYSGCPTLKQTLLVLANFRALVSPHNNFIFGEIIL